MPSEDEEDVADKHLQRLLAAIESPSERGFGSPSSAPMDKPGPSEESRTPVQHDAADAMATSTDTSRADTDVIPGSSFMGANMNGFLREGLIVREAWELTKQLGRGTFGVVYEARHRVLEKRCAIKFLLPHQASSTELQRRFHEEARVMSKLRGKHLVEILDYGELPDGTPFFMMELLSGKSLNDYLRDSGPLSLPRFFDLATQLLDGLVEIHEHGITHRDLKPANIFVLEPSHELRILDFGLAKTALHLSTSSTTMGTPLYMAPENLGTGEHPVDARSDIYSAGVIFYEMLSGQLPIPPTRPMEAFFVQLARSTPQPLASHREDVAKGVAEIIDQSLAKDPSERPQNAAAFREYLLETKVDTAEPSSSEAAVSDPPATESTREEDREAFSTLRAYFLGELVSIPNPLRVLVVDDEPLIAKMLCRFCRTEGLPATLAHDGLEAWELFQNEDFDLVVTDIRMPRLDGVALAERIRDSTSNVPFVLISGHGFVPDVDALAPATFLAKPFLRDELQTAIAMSVVDSSRVTVERLAQHPDFGDCVSDIFRLRNKMSWLMRQASKARDGGFAILSSMIRHRAGHLADDIAKRTLHRNPITKAIELANAQLGGMSKTADYFFTATEIGLGEFVRELAREHAAEKERVSIRIDDSALALQWHPESAALLAACIAELVENAIEASSNSTVSVDIHHSRLRRRVRIRVSDTGPGIPDEIKEKIWDDGFSTRGVGRGTGLFLIRLAIDSLRGDISLRNGTFEIWLDSVSKVHSELSDE